MTRYHMRREEREITDRRTLVDILKNARYAVIAMCRDNEPYIVTLSCGYDEGHSAFYFHVAPLGLKIEFINYNATVCGTVIEDRGYIQGECAHAYRSVVFGGQMRIVEDMEEKKHAMEVLLAQLEDDPAKVKATSLQDDEAYQRVGILRLDIEEMSGKQGR